MVLNKVPIGQMRSTVIFRLNSPTTSATSDREAVTTGGQNDVYSNLLTTRGRLKKKNGKRDLDLALLAGQDSYELICRFQSAINTGIQTNGKVFVDSIEYTIQTWEVIDQIRHWYKFELTCQTISGTVINLGPELITNGGFTGSLIDWTIGDGWTLNVNKMKFNDIGGGLHELKQVGTLVDGKLYRVSFNVSDGLSGFVVASFGKSVHNGFNAWDGDVSFNAIWSSTALGKISFLPSIGFGGSITNVSVKEIL